MNTMCERYEIPEKEVVPNKKLVEKEKTTRRKASNCKCLNPFFYCYSSSLMIVINYLKNQAP